MNDIAIYVENLSKLYRLGQPVGYTTIREAFMNTVLAPFHRNHSPSNFEYIWALNDVSFEIKCGEVVGIIGRNGSGKSTLLKILSRITNPTRGRAEIGGRVGSLLEVGTCFHPELTGRENIYLNGAVLGMKRAEIDRKFDDIVEFAGVENFIDTPIKRYSSGMSVRLAFAVAAHIEPDILLVDEVLAVGDYNFQNKCLGKLSDIARKGRTVLFISHNMASILNLCDRAILLDYGKIIKEGAASEVVKYYIETASESGGEVRWTDIKVAPGNEKIRLHSVRILQNSVDGTIADVDIQKDIEIQLSYWNLKEGSKIYAAIHLIDQMGNIILSSSNHTSISSTLDTWYDSPCPTGLFQSVCRIPGKFLNNQRYSISAIVGTGIAHTEARADNVVSFRVHDTGGMRKEFSGGWVGVIRPQLAWSTERKETQS